jgi:hypothetical protein
MNVLHLTRSGNLVGSRGPKKSRPGVVCPNQTSLARGSSWYHDVLLLVRPGVNSVINIDQTSASNMLKQGYLEYNLNKRCQNLPHRLEHPPANEIYNDIVSSTLEFPTSLQPNSQTHLKQPYMARKKIKSPTALRTPRQAQKFPSGSE